MDLADLEENVWMSCGRKDGKGGGFHNVFPPDFDIRLCEEACHTPLECEIAAWTALARVELIPGLRANGCARPFRSWWVHAAVT